MRIICVIPSLPEDLNPNCIQAVMHQTVPVSMIVLLHGRVEGGTLMEKVSHVLNEGLKHIVIRNFDYLLRVDGDTILHENYLEEALKDKPDMYGDSGYAMLIKVSTFIKLTGGKFNKESDDSSINHRFWAENCHVNNASDDRLLETQRKPHKKTDCLFSGRNYYRFGYEPLHVLWFLRGKPFRDMCFVVIGYFVALLKRERKFDFAPKIWRYQVDSIRVKVKLKK